MIQYNREWSGDLMMPLQSLLARKVCVARKGKPVTRPRWHRRLTGAIIGALPVFGVDHPLLSWQEAHP